MHHQRLSCFQKLFMMSFSSISRKIICASGGGGGGDSGGGDDSGGGEMMGGGGGRGRGLGASVSNFLFRSLF